MDNHTDKINNRIENIRNNIYDYNLKEMFAGIDSLVVEISNCISFKKMPKDKVNAFNVILENVNTSIRNKDYQLASDILEFQLKDFIENILDMSIIKKLNTRKRKYY